jgi:hypothetical protein
MLVEEADKHTLQMEVVLNLETPQNSITDYATLPKNVN